MKLLPSDPDIQTLVGRIRRQELDLQPDFQRGEVWSDAKKRRLIDTILRDWHVPPIHVIEHPDDLRQEVLDGQQRLVAIRDFVLGIIRVDGNIPPYDEEIGKAHNCTYETLPPRLRLRFDRFAIRQFTLVSFRPDEPGELFYRLNQTAGLTPAEQRNAFFGPVREQVRLLCESFKQFGLSESFLGFSNSRMAYDDTIAKLCVSIERGTLRDKITAAAITERYRSNIPLDAYVLRTVEAALSAFGRASAVNPPFKFNKATLFSWLCFYARVVERADEDWVMNVVPSFVWEFEVARTQGQRHKEVQYTLEDSYAGFSRMLLSLFTDRASLRVADVSSVLLRDAVLIYCFAQYTRVDAPPKLRATLEVIQSIWERLVNDVSCSDGDLLYALEQGDWGGLP